MEDGRIEEGRKKEKKEEFVVIMHGAKIKQNFEKPI